MGGAGSLSGGGSYSSSTTTNLSDIQINFLGGQAIGGGLAGSDTAYWRYQAQNLPRIYDKFYPVEYGINRDPPSITVDTAMFYNKWIWRVKDPKNNGGSFNTYCVFRPTYTCVTARSTSTVVRRYEITENTLHYDVLPWHIIALTPPPR